MMRRILPSILVLMQFAQGVAMSHSHAGTAVAEPAQHTQRPHFHFSGHASHGHDHYGGHRHPRPHHDEVPGDVPSVKAHLEQFDHDSDAVYAPDGTVSANAARRLKANLLDNLAYWDSCIPLSVSLPTLVIPPRSLPPPYSGHFNCPIFLQTLSLLI